MATASARAALIAAVGALGAAACTSGTMTSPWGTPSTTAPHSTLPPATPSSTMPFETDTATTCVSDHRISRLGISESRGGVGGLLVVG